MSINITSAIGIGQSENAIINGNFDHWQRGTSFAAAANGTYYPDRFSYARNGSHVQTVSRSTDVPTVTQSGFASLYSLLATVTTAEAGTIGVGDYAFFRYKVEGLDYQRLHAGKGRLQFWVKATGTGVTGTYSVTFANSAFNRSYTTSYTIVSSGVWQQVMIDLPFDTTGTWLFDANTIGLNIDFIQACGTNLQTSTLNTWGTNVVEAATGQTNNVNTNGNTFQLAQIQIVPQDLSSIAGIAVPFHRAGRTIGDELRACQRYYAKSFGQGVTPAANIGLGASGAITNWITTGTTTQYCQVFFPATMMTSPSMTYINPGAGTSTQGQDMSNGAVTTSVTTSSSIDTAIIVAFAGNFTTLHLIAVNWTASAEL